MEEIISIDKDLFLWLNSQHNDFFDYIMLFVTNKRSWIPFYALLVVLIIQKFSWEVGLRYILVLIASVALADFITSGLMKPFFERPRPCHNFMLSLKIHLLDGCGGKYGFASSHASTSFALAMGIYLCFRKNLKKYIILIAFFWAGIVAYSRIYIGVHYPTDILVGALVGTLCTSIVYFLFNNLKLHNKERLN